MRRKILAGLLLVVLFVSLFGCASHQDPSVPTPSETEAAPTQGGETQYPTQPPTEPPTEPMTQPPAEPFRLGDIFITSSVSLNGDYQQASVRVDFGEDSIPEQTVRIKHRGNSTQKYADKKSYNIKYGEKVSFLGMEKGKKWCLLADPFDKTLLRPILASDYALSIGIKVTSQARLCRVWLNGKYQGIYTAMEPVDDGKRGVDIDLENGDFLFERNSNEKRTEEGITYFTTPYGMRFELNAPEVPSDAQLKQIKEKVKELETVIKTKDFAQYSKVVDVESFVNFYIFQELVKDIDFGRFSTRYYVKDGVLYAGPPWDLDLSMGNLSKEYWEEVYQKYHNLSGYGNGSGDSTQGFWCNEKDFYRWLCQDEAFMKLVVKRWAEMKPMTDNLAMPNELGMSRIDWYMENAREALESNYTKEGAGWPIHYKLISLEYDEPAKDYIGNVEILRNWLIARIAWLDEAFSSYNINSN